MERHVYLRHCALVSLKRRAWWLALMGLLAAGAGVVLNLSLLSAFVFALLAALLTALGIALNSVWRHASDLDGA